MPTCQSRRCKQLRFDPWVGKIPWRRAWQPTPVFLPGESHGRVFFLIKILVALCGIWALSFLTRDQTHAPCSGVLMLGLLGKSVYVLYIVYIFPLAC